MDGRRQPWFKFYADDFLVGCLGMPDGQVGAYARLLALQWAKGPITESIAQAAGRRSNVRAVLAAKFQRIETEAGPVWLNEKLEKIRNLAGAPAGDAPTNPPGKTPPDGPGKSDPKTEARRRGGRKRAQTARRIGGKFAPRTTSTPAGEAAQQLAAQLAAPTSCTRSRNPEPETTRSNFDHLQQELGPDWEPLAMSLARRLADHLPPPASYRDRQLIAQAAIVAATLLDEAWLADVIGGIRTTRLRQPYAALQTILRDRAAARGESFDDLAALVTVPRNFYCLIA